MRDQGRDLPSPWLNSNPEGEIFLFHMDRLMVDNFSLFFSMLINHSLRICTLAHSGTSGSLFKKQKQW